MISVTCKFICQNHNILDNHDNKHDLVKILQDEMKASEGKCFQGRFYHCIH